jgi:hypothetical protein
MSSRWSFCAIANLGLTRPFPRSGSSRTIVRVSPSIFASVITRPAESSTAAADPLHLTKLVRNVNPRICPHRGRNIPSHIKVFRTRIDLNDKKQLILSSIFVCGFVFNARFFCFFF